MRFVIKMNYIMTREEIEQLNEAEPYCFETTREEQWYNVGLQQGLATADANPKSSWISVDADLPCNHKELMDGEHSTKLVLAVLVWDDDPSKKYIKICNMCDNVLGSVNVGWHWLIGTHYKVVCWMPLPKML